MTSTPNRIVYEGYLFGDGFLALPERDQPEIAVLDPNLTGTQQVMRTQQVISGYNRLFREKSPKDDPWDPTVGNS